MKLGTKDIVGGYIGSTPLKKVMLGTQLIKDFEGAPPVEFEWGNALRFSGDALQKPTFTPYPSDLQPTGYSIAAWINPQDASYRTVWGSTSSAGFGIVYSTNIYRLKINGTLLLFNFATPYNLNEWNLVVQSWDGANVRVWINNEESIEGEVAFSGSSLGRHPSHVGWDTAKNMKGDIDEFGMWLTPLSEAEANTLWNGGQGTSLADVRPNDMWCHFHMDSEGTQTTNPDSSGNGNHLVLEGFDFTDNGWIPHGNVEVQAVIDRMTTPSVLLQQAINEYIVSEQMTTNDNWELTDNLAMFDVDTYVNALVLWKGNTYIGADVSSIFEAYNGISGAGINSGVMEWDYQYLDTHPDADDSFIAARLNDFLPFGSDRRVVVAFTHSDNGTRMSGTTSNVTPKISFAVGVAVTLGIDSGYKYVMGKISDNQLNLETFENGVLINSAAKSFTQPSTVVGTRILSGSIGQHRGWITGKSVGGFDAIANAAAMRKFNDRMLIQKHIAVVQPVLDRYTNLSSIEAFAIGRLVARSEENGNWGLLGEVQLYGLATEENSLIGLKLKTATNNGATFIEGKGFENNGSDAIWVSTGLDPTVDLTEDVDNCNLGFLSFPYSNAPSVRSIQGGGRGYFLNDVTGNCSLNTQGFTAGFIPYEVKLQNFQGVRDLTFYSGTTGYVNGEIGNQDSRAGSDRNDAQDILNRESSRAEGFDGYTSAFYNGFGTGFLIQDWNTDLFQAVNELEIAFAVPNEDWNVQDKTYDWSNRELAPDQLENLTATILANSDDSVTGRILNIVGNLGITLNAQGNLNNLVNVHGWQLVQIL